MSQAIKDVIENMVEFGRAELLSITDSSELERYWYYRSNSEASAARRFYEFFKALNTYSNRCRRWEELHHGSECVVERVRDKYLYPKIRDFLKSENIA